MDTNTVSTRRRFLVKAGAALSAPLAVVGANASPGSEDDLSLEARLADLEDVNAIRKLHQVFARLVNGRAYDEAAGLFVIPSAAEFDRSIGGLTPDRLGEDDVIELASDRRSATGRFHCTVQTRTAIGPGCTLVEMARAQGEGFIERSERCVIEAGYAKLAGGWKIRRAARRRA